VFCVWYLSSFYFLCGLSLSNAFGKLYQCLCFCVDFPLCYISTSVILTRAAVRALASPDRLQIVLSCHMFYEQQWYDMIWWFFNLTLRHFVTANPSVCRPLRNCKCICFVKEIYPTFATSATGVGMVLSCLYSGMQGWVAVTWREASGSR